MEGDDELKAQFLAKRGATICPTIDLTDNMSTEAIIRNHLSAQMNKPLGTSRKNSCGYSDDAKKRELQLANKMVIENKMRDYLEGK